VTDELQRDEGRRRAIQLALNARSTGARREVSTVTAVYATITNSPLTPAPSADAVQAVVVTDGRAFRVLGPADAGASGVAASVTARAHTRFRPDEAPAVLRRLVAGLPYSLVVHGPTAVDGTLERAVDELERRLGLRALPDEPPPRPTPAQIRASLRAHLAARQAPSGSR
jgi:hypothetical protein